MCKVQNISIEPRQNGTANRVGEEMDNVVSNEPFPPPFPPQSQTDIIENKTNYLSKP